MVLVGRGRGFASSGVGCRKSNDLVNRTTIVIFRSLSSVPSLPSNNNNNNNNKGKGNNRNNSTASTTTAATHSVNSKDILNAIPTSIRDAIPKEFNIASIEHWIGHFSGTHEIQALKKHVQKSSLEFDEATNNLVNVRKLVDTSLQEWQNVSGQHSALLQRKESWTATDAEKFTSLIQREVESKKQLEQAKLELQQAESLATQSQISYMNKLRQRYQEEQSWQDHWRVLGTYGTWSLIALNSIIFLGSQFFHRRREQSRMEHIEQLILGNINKNNSNNNNNNHSKNSNAFIADVHDDDKEQEEIVIVSSKSDTNDATSKGEGKDHLLDESGELSSTNEFKSSTATTTAEEDRTKTKEEPSNVSPVLSDTNNGPEGVVRDEEMESGEIMLNGNERHTPSDGNWKNTFFNSQFWKIVTFSSPDKKNATISGQQESSMDDESSTPPATTKVKEFMTRTWSKTLSTSRDYFSKLKDEEIHVPSAVLGASVMGVMVIAVSIFAPTSNRR